MGNEMGDIVTRLEHEARRKPNETIWRDAIAEIVQLRETISWIASLKTGGMIERKCKESLPPNAELSGAGRGAATEPGRSPASDLSA